MNSPSSTDDSLREYSDTEQLEVYDESKWHDKDCKTPFAYLHNPLTSRICNACRSLFSGPKETQRIYKHYYHHTSLRITAENGCQLCAHVRSKTDRETKNHQPSEILRLEFIFYQGIWRGNVTQFELRFQYLRVPMNANPPKAAWGIEIIDFLLSERKSASP